MKRILIVLALTLMVGTINAGVGHAEKAVSDSVNIADYSNAKNMEDNIKVQDGYLGDPNTAEANQVEPGKIYLFINNNVVRPEVEPFLENGRTMVPLRVIAENLGSKVSWDGDKYEVTIERKETKIVLKIGDMSFTKNGQQMKFEDAAPLIKSDLTFVPLRFIGEALGAKVDYKDDYLSIAKLVTVTLN